MENKQLYDFSPIHSIRKEETEEKLPQEQIAITISIMEQYCLTVAKVANENAAKYRELLDNKKMTSLDLCEAMGLTIKSGISLNGVRETLLDSILYKKKYCYGDIFASCDVKILLKEKDILEIIRRVHEDYDIQEEK